MLDWMFEYIFNFYDILLLTVTTIAILLIVPLLLKPERHKSDLLLSAFLFSQGGLSLTTVLIFNESLGPTIAELFSPFHFLPVAVLQLGQGFLLLWYSQTMTGIKIKIKTPLVLISFGLMLVMMLFQGKLNLHPLHWHSLACWGIGVSIYTGIKALIRLQKHDVNIRQSYSNITNIKLNWLWYCALGFVLVWALNFVSILFGAFGFKYLTVKLSTFSNLPPLLLMSSMVIFSQTAVLNKVKILDESNEGENEEDKLNGIINKGEHKVLNEAFNQNHIDKIQDLMERVKIYQDPELRLEGLADSMNISSRSVSALLNGYFQKNFYDYINFYRVKDAQQQLSDPVNKNKTIQKVFEEAGFNSKTTFNTLFKKLTTQTPSEYRNNRVQRTAI